MSPIELALTIHHHNIKSKGPTCRIVIASVSDVYIICETPEDLILGNDLWYDSTKKAVTNGELSILVKPNYGA